ncbi:MAG: DUF6491 family protein [Pseudomonadota bacterium]
MKTVFIVAAVLSLVACASRGPSDSDRLAMIQTHAGAPVKQIRNYNAMGWDRVDDDHVLLSMRPRETWLLRVSGPCLDWGGGAPLLGLTSQGPYVMAKLDRILINGSPVSCRIEEIRPVDTKALRAAESAARDQVAAGT